MQIISAGRGTGKSTYAELLRRDLYCRSNPIGFVIPLIIVPNSSSTEGKPYKLRESELLKKLDRLEICERHDFILEEPELYEDFETLLGLLPKPPILVIGTPVNYKSGFCKFLRANEERVVRWLPPTDLSLKVEYPNTGNFNMEESE